MSSFIFVVIIMFSSLGLAGLVYFKDPKRKINQLFIVLILFLIVWVISNYLENEPINPELASLFLRIDFASASILTYFFFLFAVHFQKIHLVSSKFRQILTFLPAFIFSVLSFSDLVINQIGFQNHIIYFEKGILFPFYSLSLSSYIIVGCGSLLLKYKELKGIEKIQTLYVLLGLSFSAIIALVMNLFLQDLVSVNVFRIGNYGIFFFVGFTTYAILKHHLLEVKVILTEISVGAIALLLLVQALASENIFGYIWNGILLLIFLIFGYLLIRSVIQEIERRAELQKLYREVNKLSEAKSEFISIASHQLRTPLTAVKGYISMIIEETYGKLSEKLKKPLENVYQSNERLIRLVNDLLNLSRLEAGKLEFKPELTSLEKMISNIVEELKINAEKKGLYIKIVKPPKLLPKTMADQGKLRQVILNIIDNAIKYTKKGGITIELKKLDSREQIKISDTGEGMDRKEIKSLFQMFSRATAGTQLHKEGAGIGLYVAKKFVDMHNGKIWVESSGRGKGSTFYIELPIKIK